MTPSEARGLKRGDAIIWNVPNVGGEHYRAVFHKTLVEHGQVLVVLSIPSIGDGSYYARPDQLTFPLSLRDHDLQEIS